MIDYDDALARVRIELSNDKHGLTIIDDKTREDDFGWVFFVQTRKFLETGDRKYLVPGTTPIVVRRDNQVIRLNSATPMTAQLKKIHDEWVRISGGTPHLGLRDR